MSFQVGDTVVVTPEVKNCRYGCNEEMKKMIGKEFVVEISDPLQLLCLSRGFLGTFDEESLQLITLFPLSKRKNFSPFSTPPIRGGLFCAGWFHLPVVRRGRAF